MLPNICKRNIVSGSCSGNIISRLYYSSNSNSSTRYSFEGHCWFNINDKDVNNNEENGYIVKLGITDKFEHPDVYSNTILFVDFCARSGERIQNKWQDIFFISTPGFEYYVGSPISGTIIKYNGVLRLNPNVLNKKSTTTNSNSKDEIEKEEQENIKSKWIVEMKIKDKSEFNKLLTKKEYEQSCLNHMQTMLSWLYSWNIYKKFNCS